MSQSIGIDLGTSYSGAAVYLLNLIKLIPDECGNLLIPSMVAFNENQIIVGNKVRYQMVTNPENSVYQVKRLMGKRFNDKTVQCDQKLWPFRVVNDGNNQCRIKIKFNKRYHLFSPEEISAQIIKKLKETAEKYLEHPITNAVISVPAYFSNNQKAATRNAGLIAGLNVTRIINEPTAAALAYGFGRDKNDQRTRNILVYDLGGGTFDISTLSICGREFKVLAINGDAHLGGEDFTNRILNYIFQKLLDDHKISIEMTHQMRHRLREACEKAKRKLSEEACLAADIELDSFYTNENQNDVDYYTVLSRDSFELINKDLFLMTIELVDECLNEAKLSINEIDEVILVGGSTRIPKVRQMLEEKFTKEKVNTTVNPDEAVALGAAIEAAILSNIESATMQNMKLKDVTPLTLGIAHDFEAKMLKCIPRNSLLPKRVIKKFKTMVDNQSSVIFPIFEGENEFAKDNIYLGEFEIVGIPQGPAGSVKFDVVFKLDENGILNVSAVERETNMSESITIQNDFGRLSEEEVQHLIKYANNMECDSLIDRNKATRKRLLERYVHDVYHYLLEESTQEKIVSKVDRKCRSKNDDAIRFLSACENTEETEIEAWITELKSICDPELGEIFRIDKGRNIGEDI